jgi:inosose dehydratase
VMSARGLNPDGKFEEAALLKKTAALEAMARICKENGVALAYHNHNPEFANGNAEIEGLARHTDPALVNFLVDAGHGYWGHGDPAAFLTGHADRIVGFHLKTYKGQEQVRMGRGDWEFDKLAAAVKKTGWRGWLMTEEGGGPKTGDPADVAADREYIRKVFGV